MMIIMPMLADGLHKLGDNVASLALSTNPRFANILAVAFDFEFGDRNRTILSISFS